MEKIVLLGALLLGALGVLGILGAKDRGEEPSALSEIALWKTGKSLPEEVDPLTIAWCNATAQDALNHYRITEVELAKCTRSKLHCSGELTSCVQEKWSQKVRCDEEKLSLESKLSDEKEELLAQVAYWKEKAQGRITVAECNYQKQVAVSKCQLKTDEQQQQRQQLVESSELSDLERAKLDLLEESLASCRLEKATTEATLGNLSNDEALVRDLKEQIRKLYQVLTLCGAVIFGLVPALIFIMLTSKKGERQEFASNRELLQVLTPVETAERLDAMSKGINGFVRPLLTSLVLQDEEQFILLVPLNCHRSRKFALFGTGGDYSPEAEHARSLAAEVGPLLIILYDHSGGAFSKGSLHKMNLTPEEIARRVAPSDCDFPRMQDIGVLCWNSNSTELFISNGIGVVQDLPPVFWEQPWIQFLARQ